MTTVGDGRQAPTGDAELAALGRLVGTWQVSGGAAGWVTFEWMDGGHFLRQTVDLDHSGHRVTGIEVIGRDRDFGAAPGPAVRSCFYDNAGNTLRYVYEIEGDVLTIWGGEKGSPARYRGTFSPDGDRLTGQWEFPGGGYDTVMVREQEVAR